MRNLKRALSLTLASVMLLGMMVIGTSAASFTDADDISNVTAATVLQELEVMQGSNGKFSPGTTVTRGQMAILICKMLYGSKLNADNFAGTSQFDDVPANAYYTGYVNLASSLGIISGYGNGKFGPGAPVTTAQAALMLTKALGWFQAGELENQTWTSNAIAAVEKATSVNLFGSLKLGNNDPLSRDNVCEMVFNALTKTSPVKYNERWGTYYTNEGSIIQGVKFDYNDSLGARNFNLVYKTSTDDFGRPSTQWGIGDGKKIDVDNNGNIQNPEAVTINTSFIKAADSANLTYTKDVKLSDIYKDLSKPDVTGKTVSYKVDNVSSPDNKGGTVNAANLNSSNDNKVGAKGALTEVYKDDSNNVKIVTINTYLVKASADYNTKNEELSVIPYGVTLSSTKIKNADVAVSQFKKDDLILVTGVIESGKLVVKTAAPATLVEDVKVSAYNTADYVTAGKKYEYSAKVAYNPDSVLGTKTLGTSAGTADDYNPQKTSYTLVLDKYDYVIGVKKYSDEVTLDDMLFVKEAAKNGFNYQAKVLFMDGRTETITIAATEAAGSNQTMTDIKDTSVAGDAITAGGANTAIASGKLSINRFYEFNKKSNGDYELKDVADTRQGNQAASANGDKLLDGGKVNPIVTTGTGGVATAWASRAANDSTIFIAKDTVYTGVKNAPDVTAPASGTPGDSKVFYLMDKDGSYILAVYSNVAGVSVNSTSEYVYILEAKGEGKDENDKNYGVYTAIKDGEKVTDYQAKPKGRPAGLYEINTTEDGYPKLGTAIADAVNTDQMYTKFGVGSGSISYKSGVVNAGKGLKVNADTVVYVVDVADKSVSVMDASAVDGIDVGTYDVYAIFVSKSDSNVKTLWLAKTTGTQTITGGAATTVKEELAKGPVKITGSITGSLTVDSGETLSIGNNGSVASLTLNGGTLRLDGVTSVPTFSGSGKVEVVQDIAADITNLKATSAPVAAAADKKGQVVDASSAASRALDLSGAGKLTTYSSTKTMSELAAMTDSTTFKAMDFTVPTDGNSGGATNVKLTYYTGSAANLATVAASEWKSPNADYGVGAPGGRNEVSNEYDSAVTVTFYVGDQVTGLKFTITGGANAGDYFFKIK